MITIDRVEWAVGEGDGTVRYCKDTAKNNIDGGDNNDASEPLGEGAVAFGDCNVVDDIIVGDGFDGNGDHCGSFWWNPDLEVDSGLQIRIVGVDLVESIERGSILCLDSMSNR